MRRLARDESGFTLVELLVVSVITVILMAGLSNVFVSGLRANSNAGAALASQTSLHIAFDRLDYEARCASQAKLVSGGAGVTLTLPSQCTHASGTITWCVSGGSLLRYAGSAACSGTSQTFGSNVTAATPFSCLAPVGDYPRLQIALAANAGTTAGTSASATDTVALRNAPLTTANSAACS
jgi:prepilin-type N-terminal cleavage/methylation domain-containing protein